jgi:hypothetical protein
VTEECPNDPNGPRLQGPGGGVREGVAFPTNNLYAIVDRSEIPTGAQIAYVYYMRVKQTKTCGKRRISSRVRWIDETCQT